MNRRLVKVATFLTAAALAAGCPGQQRELPLKHKRYDHVARVVHQKVVKHSGPFGGVWNDDWCYIIFCECPQTHEVKQLRLWRSKVVADVPPGKECWAEADVRGEPINIQYAVIYVHSLDEVSEVTSEIHVHGVD